MDTKHLVEPSRTFCPHCHEDVVPLLMADGVEYDNPVDLIGLKHARVRAGHHYHGECPRCHRPLYSPVAETLNREESRFDWQTLLYVVGGIALMVIIYFAFNR
jgi:hypothetical protein